MNTQTQHPVPHRPTTRRRLAAAVAGLSAFAVVATPALAAPLGEPVSGGRVVEGENVVRGAGSGTVSSDVDQDTGAMRLESTARGGQSLLSVLQLAFLGGPTSAGSSGSLEQVFSVGPGTYRVSATFSDLTAAATTQGTGSTSELRSLFASFDCETGCESGQPVTPGSELEPTGGFVEIADGPETVTSTATVVVPPGQSGALFAIAGLSAGASAHRDGNSSASTVTTSGVTFEVEAD